MFIMYIIYFLIIKTVWKFKWPQTEGKIWPLYGLFIGRFPITNAWSSYLVTQRNDFSGNEKGNVVHCWGWGWGGGDIAVWYEKTHKVSPLFLDVSLPFWCTFLVWLDYCIWLYVCYRFLLDTVYHRSCNMVEIQTTLFLQGVSTFILSYITTKNSQSNAELRMMTCCVGDWTLSWVRRGTKTQQGLTYILVLSHFWHFFKDILDCVTPGSQ